MVARSGLGVVPVPGSPPVGMSAADHRLILGAQFGTVAQCLAGGTFTPSSSTMQFTSPYSVWAVPDSANAGAVYHSGIDAATVTPAAGPASGSRIDSIYVAQHDYEKGDSDSRAVVGLQAGTASTTPTAPSIPTGAVRIANILVPANVTHATDCTFTYVVPPTAFAEADVLAPTKALLDAQPGAYIGQRGVTPTIEYHWTGSLWKAWDSGWLPAGIDVGGVNGGYNVTPGWSYTAAQYRYTSGAVRFRGNFFLNGSSTATSQLNVALPVNASIATGSQAIGSATAVNDSDTSAKYALNIALDSAGYRIYFNVGGGAKASPVTGTAPFGESWAQSDSVTWDVTYDPA